MGSLHVRSGHTEEHRHVAGLVGMSFRLMVLYARVCIVLLFFSVVGDLAPTDKVEGAKDTDPMITPECDHLLLAQRQPSEASYSLSQSSLSRSCRKGPMKGSLIIVRATAAPLFLDTGKHT